MPHRHEHLSPETQDTCNAGHGSWMCHLKARPGSDTGEDPAACMPAPRIPGKTLYITLNSLMSPFHSVWMWWGPQDFSLPTFCSREAGLTYERHDRAGKRGSIPCLTTSISRHAEENLLDLWKGSCSLSLSSLLSTSSNYPNVTGTKVSSVSTKQKTGCHAHLSCFHTKLLL